MIEKPFILVRSPYYFEPDFQEDRAADGTCNGADAERGWKFKHHEEVYQEWLEMIQNYKDWGFKPILLENGFHPERAGFNAYDDELAVFMADQAYKDSTTLDDFLTDCKSSDVDPLDVFTYRDNPKGIGARDGNSPMFDTQEVFTADIGTFWYDEAEQLHCLLSKFRHSGRIDEVRSAVESLLDKPMPNKPEFSGKIGHQECIFHQLPNEDGVFFEGSGDNLLVPMPDGSWAFLSGCGHRNTSKALDMLHELSGFPVHKFNLKHEANEGEFFHIDTALAMLPNGYVLAHMPAFDKAGQQQLLDLFGADKIIEVGLEDAKDFACNLVVLPNNNGVLMGKMSDELKEKIEATGIEVVHAKKHHTVKSAGGGHHCRGNYASQAVFAL